MNVSVARPAEYAKAIVGAAVAAASAAIPVVDDGVTPSELMIILVAALTAFGAVWAVPNAAPADAEGDGYEGKHRA